MKFLIKILLCTAITFLVTDNQTIQAQPLAITSIAPHFSFVEKMTEADPEADKVNQLRVLSWNIYMLPRFIKNTGKLKRARAIAERMKNEDYHIIVFQEAFHKGARRILRKELKEKYPYFLGPANRKIFSPRTNSGIWIVSKIPLVEIGTVEYKDCDGFVDCFARKGALLAEGIWKGVTFQILGTHLQAGGTWATKQSQYNQIINELLIPHSKEGIPQIACGDFNTTKTDIERYPVMLKTLEVEDGDFEGDVHITSDGENNDLNTGGPGNKKVIDYIFYRGNGKGFDTFRRSVKVFTHRWSENFQHLSDHYAVEAVIKF